MPSTAELDKKADGLKWLSHLNNAKFNAYLTLAFYCSSIIFLLGYPPSYLYEEFLKI